MKDFPIRRFVRDGVTYVAWEDLASVFREFANDERMAPIRDLLMLQIRSVETKVFA